MTFCYVCGNLDLAGRVQVPFLMASFPSPARSSVRPLKHTNEGTKDRPDRPKCEIGSTFSLWNLDDSNSRLWLLRGDTNPRSFVRSCHGPCRVVPAAGRTAITTRRRETFFFFFWGYDRFQRTEPVTVLVFFFSLSTKSCALIFCRQTKDVLLFLSCCSSTPGICINRVCVCAPFFFIR